MIVMENEKCGNVFNIPYSILFCFLIGNFIKEETPELELERLTGISLIEILVRG